MANEARVTGRTGAICAESGPYQSAGTAKIVVFVRKGDSFPPDADGSATTWTLLTADVEG